MSEPTVVEPVESEPPAVVVAKKKKHARVASFARHQKLLLKKVAKQMHYTAAGVRASDALARNVVDRVAAKAAKLMRHVGRKQLVARDLMRAVRQELPPNLAQQCIHLIKEASARTVKSRRAVE